MHEITGKWGLLPFAAGLLAWIAIRLGALLFDRGSAADRAVGGAFCAIAAVIAGTRLFGLLHLLTTAALALGLAGIAAVVTIAAKRKPFAFPWRDAVDGPTAATELAAALAIVVATTTAILLPIWAWDSIGYHLPYVAFALYGHSTSAVPPDIFYISTYPHDVELFMIALRAMLPDDRLVDVAQIPFGILGAVATAGIARKLGAARATSVAAGAAWLTVPAVFLQLPTNYVDVACASLLLSAYYFVLPHADGELDRRTQSRAFVLAAIALGLYAGAKPNAPLIAAMVGLILIARAWKTENRWSTIAVLALAAAFGSEAFVTTALRTGNPIWPAKVDIGPIHLPGTLPLHRLLESGAKSPKLHGPLPLRVVTSWISLDAPPVFDMRYGGYGAIFLVALGFAMWRLLRARKPLLWGLVACSLAAPDPALARYVLAFPALVLAIAAPSFDRLRLQSWNRATFAGVIVGALAVQQLAYSFRGLSAEGPPLRAFFSMTEDERSIAIGADGSPLPYVLARRRIADDETFAFDSVFDLPYLAWDQLRYRVVYVPSDVTYDEVPALLLRNRVRVIEAADASPVGHFLASHPETFVKLFSSNTVPCSVYARL